MTVVQDKVGLLLEFVAINVSPKVERTGEFLADVDIVLVAVPATT